MNCSSSFVLISSMMIALTLSACGDSSGSDLAILGEYVDNYETNHEITNEMWTSGESTFTITQFSNETQMVIAQNSSENEWSADLWSRFDWTENAEGLWICQTTYDSDTEEAAMNTLAADVTDPANSGCSSFAWTKLEVVGE
jgi:hypothetical protein